ncbi:hypothetical protein GCM10011320_48780 [Neoroseomonas lacus]|uniref:Integrase catalytic domain-containing protein n=1 Tax=Neoroseomonas lacus TaxID=287609 RepID=A0A917KY09_9PROT|nr:hypothetical protein GCM10011320_48780 [Neoroseomonas lacus]
MTDIRPLNGLRRGLLALSRLAVMDWLTRKALSWRASNTTDVAFCLEPLEEDLARFWRPELFHTDRGIRTLVSPRCRRLDVTASCRRRDAARQRLGVGPAKRCCRPA